MSKEEILADLKKSVETWDIKLVQEATQKAIDANISVSEIIGDGLGKGMEVSATGSTRPRSSSRRSSPPPRPWRWLSKSSSPS